MSNIQELIDLGPGRPPNWRDKLEIEIPDELHTIAGKITVAHRYYDNVQTVEAIAALDDIKAQHIASIFDLFGTIRIREKPVHLSNLPPVRRKPRRTDYEALSLMELERLWT